MVPGTFPFSATVADTNEDGDPDLVTANFSNLVPDNTVSVLLGGTAGGFGSPASFPAGAPPRAVAAGDFNADGDLDLATANASGGGFDAPQSIPAGDRPFSVAVADFDGDGDEDLAAVTAWAGSRRAADRATVVIAGRVS